MVQFFWTIIFIGNLRFPFLMFQTHKSCHESKELGTNESRSFSLEV